MYRQSKDREHPWTIQEFSTDRNEQFNCASQIVTALDYNTNVLVSAPVKSGKRQIAEIVALMYAEKGPNNKHYFITALNRKDVETQKKELSEYKLDVTTLAKNKDADEFIKKLGTTSDPNNIVVHFDESDYGTGFDNVFAPVFKFCKERKIKLICYSATNEEAKKSDFAKAAELVEMVPNSGYKGAKWFLDNNLVKEPEPFFDGVSITEHGKEVIDWWLTQTNKPIAILRLTGGEREKGLYNSFKKEGEMFLIEDNIICKFIDGVSKFDWAKDHESLLKAYKAQNLRTLLVINQTCTRSTELGFHKHLAFLHDHRPNESHYSTLAQAYLRVAHYDSVGHKIVVYGEKEVFELAAGVISESDYSGKLSARVNKQTTKAGTILSEDKSHWYEPGSKEEMEKLKKEGKENPNLITDPTILSDPEKLKAEIYKIWKQHIADAMNPEKEPFASGKIYKGRSDAKVKLKSSKNNPQQLQEVVEINGIDNISTRKRHYFVYENVNASGIGGSENSTITTKRHGLENIEGSVPCVRVYSIFHDGETDKVEESTTHSTNSKSVFQS